ncbi:MAG: hypothetical protein PSV35_00950 [bacterium]|nr:hypothetical protein [bacterium]
MPGISFVIEKNEELKKNTTQGIDPKVVEKKAAQVIEQKTSEKPNTSHAMSQFAWNTLNLTAVATVTSTAIVAIQSPIKSVLLNLTKYGTFLPAYTGGALGLGRMLYTGSTASLSGSAARTVYVTNARSNKVNESFVKEEAFLKEEGIIREEGIIKEETGLKANNPKVTYVMAAALGDILVTQIPGSLSDLKKLGIIHDNFIWHTPHNIKQLLGGGFAAKYGCSMVNFSALCVLEEEYAKRLTYTDKSLTHFASGALSGMTASIFSYPFSAFVDYNQAQAEVKDGKLYYKRSTSTAKDLSQTFFADPKKSSTLFFSQAAKQMPLRSGLTASIFSIVAGVGDLLGQQPLAKVIPKEFQPQLNHSNMLFSHKILPVALAANAHVNQDVSGLNKSK